MGILERLWGKTARLSLRQNFSFSFLANATFAGCNWLLIVVLARFTNPETLGFYALGLAIVMPAFEFARLSLHTIQATDAKRQYDFCDLMGVRIASSIVLLAVITIVVLQYADEPIKAAVIALVTVRTLVWGLSDIFGGLFLRLERLDRSAIAEGSRGLLGFFAAFIALVFTGRLEIALVAQTVVWLGILTFVDVPLGRQLLRAAPAGDPPSSGRETLISPRWEWAKMRRLAIFAAPLAVANGISILLESVPRYFIDSWLGSRELGIYAAVVSPVAIGFTVINSLNAAAQPRLAHLYSDGRMKNFFKVLRRIVALEVLLGLAGIALAYLIGKEFLIIVFGPEYGDAAELFQIVMVFALVRFVATSLGISINAMHLFRLQLLLQMAQILMLIMLCLLWVRAYGVNGAVYALIAARALGVLAGAVILYWKRAGPA